MRGFRRFTTLAQTIKADIIECYTIELRCLRIKLTLLEKRLSLSVSVFGQLNVGFILAKSLLKKHLVEDIVYKNPR